MAKFVYGNNIQKACKICTFGGGVTENGVVLCTKHKKQGKPSQKEPDNSCRSFCYDPILRIPRKAPELQSFSAEDFAL